MSMIVYLNGQYVPLDQAAVSVEDRGFMFADGVYEVVRYYGGRPLGMKQHLDRMTASLKAIRIDFPHETPAFDRISEELVRRNNALEASVYWQVTRGAAPRKHVFPRPAVAPTVLAMAYPVPPLDLSQPVHTLRAITRPDVRWQHCWIKSLSLLPNVLDLQAAADAGCELAILHRDDVVTEAPSLSVIIVHDGVLWTHPLDGRILDSITRRYAVDLATRRGWAVRQEYFKLDRLRAAQEIIAVGSTTEIAAVVQLDGQAVADGGPGPVTIELFELYKQQVAQECGLGV